MFERIYEQATFCGHQMLSKRSKPSHRRGPRWLPRQQQHDHTQCFELLFEITISHDKQRQGTRNNNRQRYATIHNDQQR